jgi:hypothetical protein
VTTAEESLKQTLEQTSNALRVIARRLDEGASWDSVVSWTEHEAEELLIAIGSPYTLGVEA